jgi:hypothetical protein
MSNTVEMRFVLVHAVSEYDRRQSTRKHYNRYAMAKYLAAVEDVTNAVNCGSTRRDALTSKFNGRLLDVCLKVLKMDRSTREEQRGSL